ncbi:MAG: TlpA family protein disulfide reductase [Burkholderiales bacterium]
MRAPRALGASLAFALAAALTLGGCSRQEPAAPVAASAKPAIPDIFAASFPDLDGKMQPMRQWQGKVVVLNFWASWCPPCRQEIPGFIALQDKYRERGLAFIGLAIDQKQNAQAFADEIGINYPVLLGDTRGVDLSSALGNRLGGLPFTVVFDRQGQVAATELGGVTPAALEKIVKPLL